MKKWRIEVELRDYETDQYGSFLLGLEIKRYIEEGLIEIEQNESFIPAKFKNLKIRIIK